MAESNASLDWLYDYVLQFLRSPGWRVPILSFIDEHCLIFDSEDENKLVYTEIFNKFKDTVDTMLDNLCAEVGVSNEHFLSVCSQGLGNAQHRRIFEQILACDNYMSFKKLMIKRNRELEEQALQELKNQGHATEQEVENASINREEAELEHALAMSRALQEEESKRRQNTEDEELKKALEISEREYKQAMQQQSQEANKAEIEQKRKAAQEALEEERRQARLRIEEEERKAKERLEEEQKRATALIEEKKRQAEAKIKEEQERSKKRIAEEEKKTPVPEPKPAAKLETAEVHQAEKLPKPKESLLGDLPPVQLRKNVEFNVDDLHSGKVDVSKQSQEANSLAQKAQEIAKKNAAEAQDTQQAETLEQRQARLRKQRELILEKKRAERQGKMDEYISMGGKDLTQKPLEPLPALVPPEELERRRNIANRLKQLGDID